VKCKRNAVLNVSRIYWLLTSDFIATVKIVLIFFTNNASINPKNAENSYKKQPSSKLTTILGIKNMLTVHRMGAISIRMETPIICLADERSSDLKY